MLTEWFVSADAQNYKFCISGMKNTYSGSWNHCENSAHKQSQSHAIIWLWLYSQTKCKQTNTVCMVMKSRCSSEYTLIVNLPPPPKKKKTTQKPTTDWKLGLWFCSLQGWFCCWADRQMGSWEDRYSGKVLDIIYIYIYLCHISSILVCYIQTFLVLAFSLQMNYCIQFFEEANMHFTVTVIRSECSAHLTTLAHWHWPCCSPWWEVCCTWSATTWSSSTISPAGESLLWSVAWCF